MIICLRVYIVSAVTQVVYDQEEAREEDEAEQAYSSLDPHEDRQHNQVKLIFSAVFNSDEVL